MDVAGGRQHRHHEPLVVLEDNRLGHAVGRNVARLGTCRSSLRVRMHHDVVGNTAIRQILPQSGCNAHLLPSWLSLQLRSLSEEERYVASRRFLPDGEYRPMETYPVELDPEQIVRWLMAEQKAAPSAFRITARRTTEARDVPARRELHL